MFTFASKGEDARTCDLIKGPPQDGRRHDGFQGRTRMGSVVWVRRRSRRGKVAAAEGVGGAGWGAGGWGLELELELGAWVPRFTAQLRAMLRECSAVEGAGRWPTSDVRPRRASFSRSLAQRQGFQSSASDKLQDLWLCAWSPAKCERRIVDQRHRLIIQRQGRYVTANGALASHARTHASVYRVQALPLTSLLSFVLNSTYTSSFTCTCTCTTAAPSTASEWQADN